MQHFTIIIPVWRGNLNLIFFLFSSAPFSIDYCKQWNCKGPFKTEYVIPNRQPQGQQYSSRNCWRNISDRPFIIHWKVFEGFTLSWAMPSTELTAADQSFQQFAFVNITSSISLPVFVWLFPKPKLKWNLSHRRRNVCWTSFWGKQRPKLYVHRTAGMSYGRFLMLR